MTTGAALLKNGVYTFHATILPTVSLLQDEGREMRVAAGTRAATEEQSSSLHLEAPNPQHCRRKPDVRHPNPQDSVMLSVSLH